MVIATLYEVAGKLPAPARRGPRQQAMTRQSLKLLDALPQEPELENTMTQLRERLTKQPGPNSRGQIQMQYTEVITLAGTWCI